MKLLSMLKYTLLTCTLLATAVACSKGEDDNNNHPDEDDNNNHPLVGTWVFQEINITFLFEGKWYNVKEDGLEEEFDLPGFNQSFRGMFFVFEKDGQMLGGKNGQSQPAGNYTVSDDKITNKDGSRTFIMSYRISEKTLELRWPRTTFEIMLGELPEELYWFDDFEVILTFVKAD
jgi:hypothetical protein